MQKVADQVALLRQGEIVFKGTREEITEERLQDLYAMGESDE